MGRVSEVLVMTMSVALDYGETVMTFFFSSLRQGRDSKDNVSRALIGERQL